MMTPVGRLVLVRTHRQARAGQRHGLGDDAGADRAGDRPAARRLHHHLFLLALDLPDQHPDRPRSASSWRRSTSTRCTARDARAVRPRSAWCSPASASPGSPSAARSLGLNFLPPAVVVALIVGRRGRRLTPMCCTRGARRRRCSISRCCGCRPSAPASSAASCSALGIGALPFLLPLLLQLGFGMTPFQSGLITFVDRRRRHGHEDGDRRAHLAPLRLPPRADRQCADQRGVPRGLRDLHARRRRSR